MAKRTPLMIPDWQRPIVAVPLTQAFPELGEIKEFRSRVCLFNHDRTRVFDVVSDRYQVVPHMQAIQTIHDALETYFGDAPTYDVRSINGGARISANFTLPIKPIRIGKNDVSELRLLLRNSYDRAWTFSAQLGAYRLICSNGMMIGKSFGHIKARHVIPSEGQSADITTQLDYMISRAPALRELWSEWQDTPISHEHASALIRPHFPKKYADPLLEESRFPRSMWDFYNDLTRIATHDTRSAARRMEFDERISRMFYEDAIDGDYTEIEEDEE